MDKKITYKPYGEKAILIEWQPIIDEAILKEILNFKAKIISEVLGLNDIILAYNSLTILYENTISNFLKEVTLLKSIYEEKIEKVEFKNSVWEIPVCYDLQFGLDLEEMSNKKHISISKIIELHTEPIYTVFFIGFLPGFPYLSGLNKQLFFERKPNPRIQVDKGSVAIGGQQTGVYPVTTSGGWNIIGKTPINLFDITKSNPSFLKSGDQIKFVSISKKQFFEMEHTNVLAKL